MGDCVSRPGVRKFGSKEMNVYDIRAKTRGRYGIVLAFILGAVCGGVPGLLVGGQQSGKIRDLDNRFAESANAATATISGLESNLDRERANAERARALVDGLTVATDRNIRNLQEAIVLIKEIRGQIAILAAFYADWDTGGSAMRGNTGAGDGVMRSQVRNEQKTAASPGGGGT
jgi:hypothetical protein